EFIGEVRPHCRQNFVRHRCCCGVIKIMHAYILTARQAGCLADEGVDFVLDALVVDLGGLMQTLSLSHTNSLIILTVLGFEYTIGTDIVAGGPYLALAILGGPFLMPDPGALIETKELPADPFRHGAEQFSADFCFPAD